MHGFQILCLGVDARGVALLPHLGHAGEKVAGVNEAATQECVAGTLGNRSALAREQGFVHLDLAPEHHGVRRDLLAVCQEDAVVEHQLGREQLHYLAVTLHADALLCKDGELVDHALGPDLLKDADDQVADDHAYEKQVSPLARYGNEDCHGNVDTIEERERVLGQDLAHGLGLDVGVGVGLPGGDALLDLGGREALDVCLGRVPGGRCGVARHGLPSLGLPQGAAGTESPLYASGPNWRRVDLGVVGES